MKKIAVINDLSGFGKCSLTAAIPIISASKIQCCPLPTGIFSNQTGYDSYKYIDCTDYMRDFIDEWKKLGVHFDAILTGFIANSRQGEIISDFIDYFKEKDTLTVVDPVMADDGVIYDCYDDNSIKKVIALTQKADIITPNLTELCLICGEDYKEISSLDTDKLKDKIRLMSKSVGTKVVTTGIKTNPDTLLTTVYDNGEFTAVETRKIGKSFSGTGDIFSSYITAQSVMGKPLVTAVKNACDFILKAIADTSPMAAGCEYFADGVDFEAHLKDIE